MSMLDFFEQQLDKSGWLAFSHLTFDNSYVINIFNSRGYLAYSKSNELFINYNILDSTDTENIEHKLVYMEPHKVGMQQVLTFTGSEHLQHFNLAQYSHYRFYKDTDEETCYPKIPTEAELEGMTADPETGLFPNTDLLEINSGEERSAIGLYNHIFDYTKGEPWSGIRIEFWKLFYANHNRFLEMLNTAYGITDAK